MEKLRKILIPLLDPSQALPYIELGEALLAPNGRILALKIVEIPEAQSLSVGAEKAPIYRAALEDLVARFQDRVELKSLVRVSRALKDGIAEAALEESCDLLLLPWKGFSTSEERLFGSTIDGLLGEPPCNVIVARGGELASCRRILLPIRGGPHAEFALEVASRLGQSLAAQVTVLHCDGDAADSEMGDRPFRYFLRRLRLHPHIKRLITVRGDVETAILQEAETHEMIIVGAGYNPAMPAGFLGPIVERIARETDKPLLVVKTPEQGWIGYRAELRKEPPSISEKVDKWFAENTFHRSEFEDVRRLVDLKEKQGVKISLGLPALNEAETIGNIIRTMKHHLLEQAPLLDEIVLIDSSSTDSTRAIAEELGIPTYIHQEILPQHGAYRGKGEALWKSLYVLNGDIIVWIDTDIRNIHPGFVYGVLGPLLAEPEIQYVKGFYRRPLRSEGKIYAEGGGRVTELTARPFFNLFFPELSGVIQPLAGEYAGRRSALEQVPFFTGYGVETGLLIDLFARHGLRALAQVDLEERMHRNQALAELSQMSFAIIQVFMQRLQEKNRIQLIEEVNQSMKLIKSVGRTYALDVKEIREHERPPMVTVPEYRARRKALAQ
ncbi:MAG TPA: glucosyl-3-phosphoglycerate synthase [Candidatus Acidoferrales bacterium]|nr:glucosyl-3-phosphoglycerate synthase [Candidatus Acidoferrales bacterium]